MTAAAGIVLLRVDREADRHTRHPRHLHPALDLKYVQAALEAATQQPVPLLDGWLAPFSVVGFATTALACQPRIAVVRAVSWCLAESIDLGRRLRAAGVITVAVGQQVQHVARTGHAGWDDAFDLALAGEPEAALPPILLDLAQRLAAGEPAAAAAAALRGRCTALGTAQVSHPDALPLPRFSAAELAEYPFPFPLPGLPPRRRWGYLLTAWGCPRPCRHCTALVRRSVGRPLRPRSVDAVADEVAALRDGGAEALFFEDDSLFVHKPRLIALADRLVQRGLTLPWLANARPDELDDERVAAAAAAGAALLKVGVDCGAPQRIAALGKTPDGEAWIAASIAAFERLRAARIGSVALMMVGLPDETPAEVAASLSLACRLPADYLQVQTYRPYPDVDLWPDLPAGVRAASGRSLYHYGASGTPAPTDDQANCSALPDALLAVLPARFYRRFYLRPGYAWRHLSRCWRHYLSPAGLAGLGRTLGYLVAGGRTAPAMPPVGPAGATGRVGPTQEG